MVTADSFLTPLCLLNDTTGATAETQEVIIITGACYTEGSYTDYTYGCTHKQVTTCVL
jgi:hypothetical protein